MPTEAISPLWEGRLGGFGSCGKGLSYMFRVPEAPVVMVTETE